MPTLSTTIEDSSPVIVYSGSGGGDWLAGTSSNDALASLYSEGSFTLTSKNNANASFSFYGTGVQIFGAKRGNHGPYQVTIDSTTYAQVNGQVPDPGSFQTSLFSAVALTNGFHKVTIVNFGNTFLDIDFITWQTSVGTSDEPLLSSSIQDSESPFTYTPESAWNASPPNVGMFSGGTGQASDCSYFMLLASMTSVSGSAVAIYGPVGPSGAAYSVQLDNNSPANYSTNKLFYRPQQVLFQAGNLASGQHTVKMIQLPGNNSALSFSIDYAQVFTAPSLQGSATPGRLSTGAITGIAIGTVAFLAAIIAVLIIFLPSKYLKYFRLKGRSVEKGSISRPFQYQRVSGEFSAGVVPQSATYGRPSHSVQPSQSISNFTPPSSGLFSSGGTYAPSTDTLPQGPNAQVISIPFTTDGKYRPDLPNTPQLLPPPGMRRDPSPSSSRSQLNSTLPPGAAQPGVITDDELGWISQESRGSSQMRPMPTPLRRPTTASLAWTEPPQYQR